MKELIEKYQKEIADYKAEGNISEEMDAYTRGIIEKLESVVSDLESLQSKGKTPTNEDIACEILARFHYTPHPNQRDKYNREKKAFADGAMWVREEYAQSHANQDGWVSVEDLGIKLSPFANLIRIMEDFNVSINERISDVFFEELKQCKANLQYLSNPPQP